MKFKRIFVVILDSIGVGEAADAANYGDTGSNTLKNIINNYELFIPNLEKLGFLSTLSMEDNPNSDAYYTIARPNNAGKDSLAGHYEIFGIKQEEQFKTFNEKAFPIELVEAIEQTTKQRVIGNKVISGEKIIEELGERHLDYGALILYTSADSTLHLAAHEDLVSVSKLHTYCKKVRKLTIDNPEWKIARVIARPFTGKVGKFRFTTDRKDYSIDPPENTIFDKLKAEKLSVISIGKITDLFNGRGITKIVNAKKNNIDTLNKLNDIMTKNFEGLCVANLSDFDSVFGHNRDIEGYGKSIEELDVEIPMLLNKLSSEDLLIMTADHGCDPSFPGNSHTRENVPVIIFGRNFKEPKKLDVLETMGDIAATIADNFELEAPEIGTSFLDKLI